MHQAANVREIRRGYNRATKLPKELVEELARVTSQAQGVWQEAKTKNEFDWALFAHTSPVYVDLEQPATLEAIGQVLIDAGAPLMVHASEPVGHDYPGKGTATPDRMLHFLRGHPDLTMVLAHWGGGLPFYELMPEVAIAAKNVVYDSAASSYLYRPAVFRAVLDIVGPERVLWASDHPVLTMRRFLARTGRDAALRPEEEAAVMAGNARRVYRLPDIETRQAGTEP